MIKVLTTFLRGRALFFIGPILLIFSLQSGASDRVDMKAAEELIKSRHATDPMPTGATDAEKVLEILRLVKANLPRLQKQEVSNYFEKYLGVESDKRNPYKTVKALSRKNLRRILNGKDFSKFKEYNLIYDHLGPLFKSFRHNRVAPAGNLSDHPLWLSSKMLQDAGLSPGLQGQYLFNKSFLGTQNWVFFFVGAYKNSDYGRHSVFVSGDYAEEVGLVFPFVMYGPDLIQAGYYTDPDAAEELIELIGRSEFEKSHQFIFQRLEGWKEQEDKAEMFNTAIELASPKDPTTELIDARQQILERFRNSLSNFSFTVKDYRTILASEFTRQVIELKQKDKAAYQKLFKQLTLPDSKLFLDSKAITEASRRLGIPTKYELRLPVAIPQKHLSQRLTCSELLKSDG